VQQNRRALLTQLAANLTLGLISEVVTVVRSYMPLEISNYASTDLPLIEIQEMDEEIAEDMISQRQMRSIDIVLRVWFVSWAETPAAAYETLMKNIRNTIAADFTLSGKATECRVGSVSKPAGEMPLYSFEIGLRVHYYLDEKDV